MSSVFDVLGLDPETLEWQDLALCRNMDTNLWYDQYEADEEVAKNVDSACLSCPVKAQCLMQGIDNNEWGVWGGIYLTAGKPDENRNSHKTPAVWKAIREALGAESIH